jgi:glucan biosynthesis protein C
VQRLLIPLAFGLLVLVPPQAYLARMGHGGALGTYLGFLGDYFGHPGGDLTGYTGQITPGSLWFILYLLAFSALALPLFLFLRGRAGKRWTAAAAGFFSRRGTLWLWALPLALTDVLPGSQGVNPLFYAVLFVYGFLLLSDERYQAALDRQALAALLLGAATMAAVLAAQRLDPGWPDGSPPAIGLTLLSALNTWLWVCGLLGMGHRALNSTGRLQPLVSEAAYPFYLLHQTVIVAAGYWVVQWPVSIVAKFLSIGLASLAGTVGLYLVAVRPWRIGRWLFGMKRR